MGYLYRARALQSADQQLWKFQLKRGNVWWANSKKFGKMIQVWHLLRGITLWIIWIERNGNVFNHEEWHKSKMKHRIWYELIFYVISAWKKINKLIKTSRFSALAIIQGFDKTWGLRGVLVGGMVWTLIGIGKDNVDSCWWRSWWFRGCSWLVRWGWSFGWWVRWVVFGGVRSCFFYLAVFVPKGPHLPLVKGMLYCFLFNGVGPVGLMFNKNQKIVIPYTIKSL